MADAVKQPIAALLDRWAGYAEKLEVRARSITLEDGADWRDNELGAQAIRIRQCMRELSAAVSAQCGAWLHREHSTTMRPPTPHDVMDRCIRDLRGDS